MKAATEKSISISPAAHRRLKAIKAKANPRRTMRELVNEIILQQPANFAAKVKP